MINTLATPLRDKILTKYFDISEEELKQASDPDEALMQAGLSVMGELGGAGLFAAIRAVRNRRSKRFLDESDFEAIIEEQARISATFDKLNDITGLEITPDDVMVSAGAGALSRTVTGAELGIKAKTKLARLNPFARTSAQAQDRATRLKVAAGYQELTNRAVVQSAGDALRLELKPFREEFRRSSELHRLLLLYTQALLTQMSQTAVCNRLHSVEQQLCRWLLLSLDRLESNELIMTQELIANMLGVRREGVSVAAHRLQQAGLIRYQRGHITIVDRPGLESRVCECYQVVKKECDRLLAYPLKPLGPGA